MTLSDSTHGAISHFELVTLRVRDSDGAEGLGRTYTVGCGGDAVGSLAARELAPLPAGRDADAIERLSTRVWWGLHVVGRGGAAAFATARPAKPSRLGRSIRPLSAGKSCEHVCPVAAPCYRCCTRCVNSAHLATPVEVSACAGTTENRVMGSGL